MSTIEDAGTNFEESAATMTVPGKEMKDGEGTIGMTGETILTSFPLDPTPAPQPSQPFRAAGFVFFVYPFPLVFLAFSLTESC